MSMCAWRASLGLAVLFLAAGCGGGLDDAPTTYPVTGTVTDGGKPLADVKVDLVPIEDGIPSSGYTDAEGKFTISRHTGEAGAIPGNYKVVLSEKNAQMDASAYSNPGAGPPKPADSKIPEKWRDKVTSPQIVEVKEEDNVVTIDVSKS